MRMRRLIVGCASAALCLLVAPALLAGHRPPSIMISVSSHVLEIQHRDGRHERFPVAVGRPRGRSRAGPRGTWFAGPDPTDATFFTAERRLPAFHRGLPFLRLSPVRLRPRRSDVAYRRAASQPYGIHGPITPTLIWGAVTAGCIRMQPAALRRVYAFARAHPGVPVRYTRRRIPPPLARVGSCPALGAGARRLRVAPLGTYLHGRVCGGIDHWYSVDLQGGDVLAAQLLHRGKLRLELYGIRAISTVARGRYGLRHRLPLVRNSRGARYLRVVAPRSPAGIDYTLRVERLR